VEKEKIHLLKKELSQQSPKELVEICLSMAKLKVENKELLTYLLYDAENPLAYAQRLKQEIHTHFNDLNVHYYYATKSLRKTLRLINKYSRFTKCKEGEIELLLYFAQLFIEVIPKDTKHLHLLGLQNRSLTKAASLIQKIHEDLHYDYLLELNKALEKTKSHFKNWQELKLK
jgi:DNA polymerase III gamma/tau subunit